MIKIIIFIIGFFFTKKYGVEGEDLYFREEPPYKVDFSNVVGAKVSCVAEGDESKPVVKWTLSDGTFIDSIPGLREIHGNGDLVFKPFRTENYRLDVHSAMYRCVAENSAGQLKSREVHVNGVIMQSLDIKVYDTYVNERNTAVLSCQIPKVLTEYVKVIGWMRNDNMYIQSSLEYSSNDKYSVMPNGDLHIYEITTADSSFKYKCKAVNSLTEETQISSNAGQIFVNAASGMVAPRMVETSRNVIAHDGRSVVLPCVVQGNPAPTVKWYKSQSSSRLLPLNDGFQYTITRSGLVIRNIQSSDSGTYICKVDTPTDLQLSTDVIVFVSVSVKITPNKVETKSGDKVVFKCEISGQPVDEIIWFHNGKPVQNNMDNKLIINSVMESSRGIYQCMVKNDEQMMQSSAEIYISEVAPYFTTVFEEVVLQPGLSASISCTANGIPPPSLHWKFNGEKIESGHRIRINNQMKNIGVSSQLVVDRVVVEDGGLYSCIAINSAGTTEHDSRINVYGELGMHNSVTITAVSDSFLNLNCPYYGYPIQIIEWEKDGQSLPDNIRQKLFENGTLKITNIDKITDAGQYKCFVKNDKGIKIEGRTNTRILVQPKIVPFEFQDELLREGMRARLQCVISEGDLPLKIEWLKDGNRIPNELGILIKALDEFSNILTIHSITPKHNGKYTCAASNDAATATHSAQLSVNVPPKVIPFSFLDDQFYKGMRSLVTCAISQGDQPLTFEWLKDGKTIPTNTGIVTRKYDQNTDSLSIENVDSRHSGNYTCIVRNQAGKAMHTAQLMVRVQPKIVPFQFGDLQYEGSPARVVCGLQEGDAPIHFSWLHNDQPINNDGSFTISNTDGLSSILSISNLMASSHAGTFTCIARNGAGVDRHKAVLRVNVPPKIVPFEFKEEQLVEGLMARVSCIVSRGDLPLDFNWEKNGVVIEPGSLNMQIKSFDEHSSILSIPSVSAQHNGWYTCFVKNDVGMARHSAKLVVKVPPRWIERPRDTLVLRDSSVMLNCSVDGFPKPEITWKFSRDMNDLDKASDLIHNGNFHLLTNGSILIKRVSELIEGFYYCHASNGIGKGLGGKLRLKINVPPHFKDGTKKINAVIGADAEIKCSVEGDLPLRITWYKDNKLIQSKESSHKVNTTSSTIDATSILTIYKVDRSSNANYTCKVENKYGSNETAIELLVLESPDAPTQLKVESVESTAVEISWTPSYNGNELIKRYLIQCKDTSASWDDAAILETVNGVPTNSIINQLRPSTTYIFRVFAENIRGRSLASQNLRVTTEEDVPSSSPTNVQVEPINTKTFKVSWKAPEEKTWNGKILGYNIGYKEVDSEKPFLFKTLVTTDPNSKELFVHIGDLKQFTKYAIIAQAYNSKGAGPHTDEIIAMTSEGAPIVAPTAIRCTTLTSQSIHVTWTEVPAEAMNGILHGYKVLYKQAMDWLDDFADHFNVTLQTSITLNELEKFANYSVQIQALTKAGHGPKSDPVFCKTLDDVPAAPSDIKSIVASENSVIVAWKSPENPNGVIKSYTLYWKESNSDNSFAKQHMVSSDINDYEINGLKTGIKYEFWVTASTHAGEGQVSKLVSQILSGETVPAKIVSFDSKTATPWKSNIHLLCKTVGIPEPTRTWSSRGRNVETMKDAKISADGSLTLYDVKEVDAGDYVCTVRNDLSEDKITHTVIVLGPPDAPEFDVTTVTFDAMELQWKTPLIKNFRVKGYTLHMRKDGGVWKDISVAGDARSYRINSLDCGTRYEIYMSAFNKIGVSASSSVIVLSTNGSVPASPLKSDMLDEDSTSVSLYLNTWKSNGCPIQYFMVEYAAKSSNQWAIVSSHIKPEQRKLVIPGLKSGTWYKMRMTGHNSAGSTIAIYEFATLTTSGGTVAPDLQMDSSNEQIDGLMAALNLYVIVPVACTVVILIAIFGLACLCIKMKKREIQAHNAANRMSTMTEYYQGDTYDIMPYMQMATMQRQLAGGKQYSALDEIAPYATLPIHRECRGSSSNPFDGIAVNQQFIIPHGFIAGPSQTETTFTFPDPPPDAFKPALDSQNDGYQNEPK